METLKSHYRLLLGLDKTWDVVSVELSVAAKSVTIALEYRGRGGVCPECKAECGLKDHAPERTWRHLDTMKFETVLKARIRRVNCSKCGVKTISVPWGEKHSRFTLMFEAFVINVLQCAGSVKAGALLLGLSWDAAHEIMKRAVERGLEKRDLEGIRYVGIDEKSFGKGQDYISVMTDPKGSRVIEVAEGRTEESAGILWDSLTTEQKSHIAAVSIDMWQAFENSVVSHAPQAEIVFDRFHISKHLNEGVDKVRREEHRELMKKGDDRLKGMRHHLLFNAEEMDEVRQNELNAPQKQHLRCIRAWGIKDYFRWFWDEPDAIAGREFFDHWYNWANRLPDSAGHLLLTRKLVKQSSAELYGITEIGDQATEILGEGSASLVLNTLTSLSDRAAESLGRHRGHLALNGLTTLSDVSAESLTRHQGSRYKYVLELNGLTTLSGATAEAFGRHKGNLSLNGLTTLSDVAAHGLGRHEGRLYLSGLTSLSDAAALSFAGSHGTLLLNGLKTISDAAAKSLSEFKGDLYLNGLIALSDAAAEHFSQHEGSLYLKGVKTSSDAAIASLGRHNGGVFW